MLGIELEEPTSSTCRCWSPTHTVDFLRGPNGFPMVMFPNNVVEGDRPPRRHRYLRRRFGEDRTRVPGRHRPQRHPEELADRADHLTPTLTPTSTSSLAPSQRHMCTTTSCSTRTSSPETAVATRTSASPPCTPSSTPSTTGWRATSTTSDRHRAPDGGRDRRMARDRAARAGTTASACSRQHDS